MLANRRHHVRFRYSEASHSDRGQHWQPCQVIRRSEWVIEAWARRTLSGGTEPGIMEPSQVHVMADSEARLDGHRIEVPKPLLQTAQSGPQD